MTRYRAAMSRSSSRLDIPSMAAWWALSSTQLVPGPDASSSRTGGEAHSGGALARKRARAAASSFSSEQVT
jgi:hypothetical protein